MKQLLLTACMLPALLLGCEKKPEAPVAASPPPVAAAGSPLLTDSIQPVVMELSSEAVPIWREALPQKGTLVLMAIHPLLEPIAAEREQEIKQLVANGTRDDFWKRGSFYRADPALVPTETLSAALLGGLFSEIVWVFPNSVEPEQLSLETFRKQLLDARFLTEEEGRQLSLANSVFTGTVRGVPFRAVHPSALPMIDGPFVLHVDLGYFRGLYQGDVKTPIYDVLHSSCLSLQATVWRPQVVTLSYSTIEGTISHDVRFLLSNFADLLRNPQLLEEMPASWAKRGEAMYAVNFFLEQKVREMYQQNAAEHPADAAAQYDYYLSLFEEKRIDEALRQLDKAAALDSGYAAVYLELAQVAETDRNLPVAVELLAKGGETFPVNPFIDFYQAGFLLQMGRTEEAKPLLDRLAKLPWSPRYHVQVPAEIKAMADYARNPQPSKPAAKKG